MSKQSNSLHKDLYGPLISFVVEAETVLTIIFPETALRADILRIHPHLRPPRPQLLLLLSGLTTGRTGLRIISRQARPRTPLELRHPAQRGSDGVHLRIVLAIALCLS
jgi:hypothetical protein